MLCAERSCLVYVTNRFLSLSSKYFTNDISILEYGKVDGIESRGMECKFVRFPKMQMRDSAESNSPFSIPLNPFARFSAFESDMRHNPRRLMSTDFRGSESVGTSSSCKIDHERQRFNLLKDVVVT